MAGACNRTRFFKSLPQPDQPDVSTWEQVYTETLETCPVCGGGAWQPFLSQKDHTLTQEVFHLTTCGSCGFCATNPRPDRVHIGRYYDSPEYISHTNSKAGLLDRLYQFIPSPGHP